MANLFTQLRNDENGFIVSAELVLVATICVLGLVVGLAELSFNINTELEDVGSAFACVQQTYCFEMADGTKGHMADSAFWDSADVGSGDNDITCNGGFAGNCSN